MATVVRENIGILTDKITIKIRKGRLPAFLRKEIERV